MDSKARPKKRIDWRNTLYEFHKVAVPKFQLRPQEIAIYTALLSCVKSNGKVSKSNVDLMAAAGIGNERTFKKARDRLVETGTISIIQKGIAKKKNTTYKIKLLGPPKKEGATTGKTAPSQLPAELPPVENPTTGKTA